MEPRLAENPLQSELSPIRETFKRAKGDPTIADLCIGDPSFPPPPQAITSMKQALDRGATHYENDAGSPALRSLLAETESEMRGVSFDPYRHIVVVNGGTNGIYSISRAVLDPGDEVLLPNPIWIPFIQITRLLNCTPVMIPTSFESHYLPSIADLEARLTTRSKMVVAVSPGNPTGAIYDEKTMKELVEFCDAHELWLLHDEAYRDIVFGGYSQPSFVGKNRCVIGVRTLSKSHAMTGFRVGWVISSNERLIERVRLNVAYNVMCVSTPAQVAAVAALKEAPDYLEKAIIHYEARLRDSAKRLGELGFDVHWPRGSFYLFPRHSYGDHLAARLWDEASLAVVDGRHFGPAGRGHFRISCAAEDEVLKTGLDRLASWVRANPS